MAAYKKVKILIGNAKMKDELRNKGEEGSKTGVCKNIN